MLLMVSFPPCRVEGGELFDRVVDKGKFTEPIAKLYFYQMLSAVKVSSKQHDCACFHGVKSLWSLSSKVSS